MAGTDHLEAFVVDTTDSHADAPLHTYVCTCGWDTQNRRDFQQHLHTGHLTGCGPRDLQINVSDTISATEQVM